MNRVSLTGCSLRERGVAPCHELRVVAARALPAQCQQNLQLSTAPVRAGVYVQDFHSPINFQITEPVRGV